jgi:hypothetical protein
VPVQVDEARRDDQTVRIELPLAVQALLAQRLDPAVADADIAHGVEARFRVHDASPRNHDIVRVLSPGKGCDEEQQAAGQR